MGRYRVYILLIATAAFAACTNPPHNNQNARSANQASSNTAVSVVPNDIALLNEVNAGNTEGVRQMVENGANVNSKNESGVTPLMNASGMGNKEIVELLLAKGADVNAKTPGNYTALMQAALVGQTEIARLLLAAGADPSVKDVAGKTAQNYAEEKGHKEIAALLRQKK